MTQAAPRPLAGPDAPGPALAHLAGMPRVDLMPPEIAERRALRRLQTTCLAAVGATVLIIGALYYQAHSSVNSAQDRLTSAQAEQSRVQRQVNALAPISASYTAVLQAQQLVAEALGGEVRWSTQLRDLSLSIPANVWLTNMSITRGGATAAPAAPVRAVPGAVAAPTQIATISFTGVAVNRDDVATWLESLAKEKGYVDAYYSTAQEAPLGGKVLVNFSSTVKVTDAALSGRFTAPAGG